MNIEESISQFGTVKFAILVAVFFGPLFLILYRRTVSNEIEPFPVALTLFGIVETVIVTIGKDPIPRMGILALCLLVIDSLAIILIFGQQRRLTDSHIEDILKDPLYLSKGTSAGDPSAQLEILKWVGIGHLILDVDIFPRRAPLEALFGARAERRQKFWEVLPSTLFDKDVLKPTTFLIPEEKTRTLRQVYQAAIALSFIAMVLLLFVA